MAYLVGIDVGSSDCKAIMIDPQGTVIASARRSYPTDHPQPGWAEQNPADWYASAILTIRDCLTSSDIDPQHIAALSIDGPAHNVALLDETGAVIHPTLHWSDLRSAPQCERLASTRGAQIFDISYAQVNPSWTLAQLLWLREEAPETWAKLRHILVTKDYVRYRFTGLYQTDVYDAIGTQLYDVRANQWSAELCDLVGFPVSYLPTVLPAGQIAGGLTAEAARDTGLMVGTPVAVGSGDSVVEALGIGVIAPGQCIVKLGTAANVNVVLAQAQPSRQAITYRHLVEPYWFTITATNSGASTMRWFRETFCRAESERAEAAGVSVYDLIEDLSAGAPPGADGLLFHPYLNGERSPYWNPYLRGDFIGISASHTMQHFARAVLEGVAYSIRDCFEVVQGLGQPIRSLSLIGGGAKSALWRQILCDVLGRPLLKPAVEDAAYGAALLAGVAAGVFPNWQTAARTCARLETTLTPDMDLHDLYTERFALYRAITRVLTPHYHALHERSRTGESYARQTT